MAALDPFTWLIRGRRRAECWTQAAAQATIRAISLWLYSFCNLGSRRLLKFPSSKALESNGLACNTQNQVYLIKKDPRSLNQSKAITNPFDQTILSIRRANWSVSANQLQQHDPERENIRFFGQFSARSILRSQIPGTMRILT